MTFTRPANHRQLTFEEIAKSAKITVNEVQLLDSGGSVGKPRGIRAPVSMLQAQTWCHVPPHAGPWAVSHGRSLRRWSCW